MPEFYVTFGDQYPTREAHPTFPQAHRDGWLTVIAGDISVARAIAFERLGQKWSFIYASDDDLWKPEFFPLGELDRFEEADQLR